MSDQSSIQEAISCHDKTSDLIGDGSQPYALPTLKTKHDRFKRIDATTLVKLINGDFKDIIDTFTIVDCRYPYEYHGGHIVNSLNIHNTQELTKLFIDDKACNISSSSQQHLQPISSSSTMTSSLLSTSASSTFSFNLSQPADINNDNKNRHIIIFHCEYSSERGPKLMRFLREKDRQINKYPELLHPELYLLEGGYRDFYDKYKEYCVPQAYRPMNCRNHRDELRKFRKRKKATSTHQRRKENKVPDISFEG